MDNIDSKIRLARHLANGRKGLNMTQAELAKKLGIRPAQVSHWETAQQLPSLPHFKNICAVLNLDSNFVLGLKP